MSMLSMRSIVSIAFLCLLAALPAFAQKKGKPPPSRTIAYKQVGDVELKLHLFEPAKPSNNPVPAMVFFFGGGWTGGTPSQFYHQCNHFASLGLVAFAAEYRVKERNGATPFECVKDGKSAVRWIRAQAKDFNIDPDRIVSAGGSAGGHVAACTGTLEGLEEDGEDLAISSKPNAMMLFNPVIDTTKAGYGAEEVGENPEQLSPVHHVRKGLAPTLIFHGVNDTTVPFENVERFTRLMKEAGNTCRLVPFEGCKHGFFNYGRVPGAYEKTMTEADAFLTELGYLPVSPEPEPAK